MLHRGTGFRPHTNVLGGRRGGEGALFQRVPSPSPIPLLHSQKDSLMTPYYQAAQENLFGHVAFLQGRTPGMMLRDSAGRCLLIRVWARIPSIRYFGNAGDGLPCRIAPGSGGKACCGPPRTGSRANVPVICWRCRERRCLPRPSAPLPCGPAPRTKAR